jgi:hypothetical protein
MPQLLARSFLTCLAASIFLGSAFGQTDMPTKVYTLPQVGMSLSAMSREGSTRLTSYTAVIGPTTVAPRDCSTTLDWVTIPVHTEGWLTLQLSVRMSDADRYKTWLDSPSGATEHLTNRLLLRRLWVSLRTGFDVLASGMGRPKAVEFAIRVSPPDCRYVEIHEHSATEAIEKLLVPVALHDPSLVDADFVSRPLLFLFEVAAHELVHVYQMYPFGKAELNWIRRSKPFLLPGEHTPMSLEAELRARMVDRCFRQAILPNDWNGERLAQTWRDRRSEYDALMAEEPYKALYDALFARQSRMLGSRFVNTRRDEDLATLFGYCAMYMRRDTHVGNDAAPTLAEQALGRAALNAIRRETSPILLQRRPYDDMSLP